MESHRQRTNEDHHHVRRKVMNAFKMLFTSLLLPVVLHAADAPTRTNKSPFPIREYTKRTG